MNTSSSPRLLTLEPNDPQRLAEVCGQFDSHLRLIEERLDTHIACRGNVFQISGDAPKAAAAERVIQQLYLEASKGRAIDIDDVHLQLSDCRVTESEPADGGKAEDGASVQPMTLITTAKMTVKPRGRNQQVYVRSIRQHDINFGIGPAGTGKTWLAVACAVEALLNDEVQRILLVRPAVEAGEKLGFLPGDLAQKIDPYLRPLYDALYEMLGVERVLKLIERGIIEIAPLAYMRGRTLNDAFVILDESQNTTREQMKMFLTRIGFGSTAVINGDATQIDLPRGTPSGLTHVLKVLDGVEGIGVTWFGAADVVRHPMVQRVIEAYERFDSEQPSLDQSRS